jgi:hypothetical protein
MLAKAFGVQEEAQCVQRIPRVLRESRIYQRERAQPVLEDHHELYVKWSCRWFFGRCAEEQPCMNAMSISDLQGRLELISCTPTTAANHLQLVSIATLDFRK